jgi:hypothetical protein
LSFKALKRKTRSFVALLIIFSIVLMPLSVIAETGDGDVGGGETGGGSDVAGDVSVGDTGGVDFSVSDTSSFDNSSTDSTFDTSSSDTPSTDADAVETDTGVADTGAGDVGGTDAGEGDAGVDADVDTDADADAGGDTGGTNAGLGDVGDVDAGEAETTDDLAVKGEASDSGGPEVETTDVDNDEGETSDIEENKGTGNSFEASITPNVVVGPSLGFYSDFTVTLKELSSSTPLASARLDLPGTFDDITFDAIANIEVKAADGTSSSKTWTGGLVDYVLSLWAEDSASFLGQDESVSATFTAKPTAVGVHEVIVQAWTDVNVEGSQVVGTADTRNYPAGSPDNPVVVLPVTVVNGTIKGAISAAAAGDTVSVEPGIYTESNIEIDKSLNVIGASKDNVIVVPAAEDDNDDSRYGDTFQHAFIIKSNDVTIKNLTIDGQGNPLLTAGKNNYRNAIVTDTGANRLHVENVAAKNIYRRGIEIVDVASTGHLIENCTIDNVTLRDGIINLGGGSYIGNNITNIWSSAGATGAIRGYALDSEYIDNTIDNVMFGIISDLGDALVRGNNINDVNVGIVMNNIGYPNARLGTIQGNTITNLRDTGAAMNGVGMSLVNLAEGSIIGGPNIEDRNYIDITNGSGFIGMNVWWNPGQVTVQNNKIDVAGNNKGMFIQYTLSEEVAPIVTGNVLNSPSPGEGIGIYLNEGADKGNVYATLKDNSLSNLDKAVLVEQSISGKQVKVDINSNQMLNNTVGIEVRGDPTLIVKSNSISGNTEYGIKNLSLNVVIDAINNWWGDASGPSTHPDDFVDPDGYVLDPDTGKPADGSGDAVSVNVLFDPWLEQDPFAPDPDPDPDPGPGDVSTPDFDAQAIEQLLLPSITAAPTVVSGAGTAITPGFVTQGTAADLAGAKDAYQAAQQALNDNRANMTPAEIAVAELDLAVANAAILSLELVLGTGNASLAAAVAAYRVAVAAFAANGGLLTPAQQAAVAEVLAEVAAALTARGAVL